MPDDVKQLSITAAISKNENCCLAEGFFQKDKYND